MKIKGAGFWLVFLLKNTFNSLYLWQILNNVRHGPLYVSLIFQVLISVRSLIFFPNGSVCYLTFFIAVLLLRQMLSMGHDRVYIIKFKIVLFPTQQPHPWLMYYIL